MYASQSLMVPTAAAIPNMVLFHRLAPQLQVSLQNHGLLRPEKTRKARQQRRYNSDTLSPMTLQVGCDLLQGSGCCVKSAEPLQSRVCWSRRRWL